MTWKGRHEEITHSGQECELWRVGLFRVFFGRVLHYPLARDKMR
jgi:hypothetical protein